MAEYSKLTHGLREILQAILSGTYSRQQLNALISICHTLARSFIASKTTTGTLTALYDLNTSDLAYDCIAELFHQDDDGKYLQLNSYFSAFPLARVREEEILAQLRRLVFSKVNQGIYRMYAESDPSLAKILRNIKLAIHSLNNFKEIDRFGESCIVPCLRDTLEHLPPAEPKELERQFTPHIAGTEFIPDILAKLSLYLHEQTEHSRVLPVVSVGLLIRSVYTRNADEEPLTAQIDQNMVRNDTEQIITEVCDRLRNQTGAKYVGKGKTDEKIFCSYFQVIAETLVERFVENNGADGSLFEQLRKRIPDLGKTDYLENHRNKLEYLLKLAEKQALRELRKG